MNKIILLLIITISCSGTEKVIDKDFHELTKIIQENYHLFKSNSDTIPRTIYTKSLNETDFIKKQKFNDILLSKQIKQIYVCSMNEIWYVTKSKTSTFFINEQVIGTYKSKTKSCLLNYYEIKNPKELSKNWYRANVKIPIID